MDNKKNEFVEAARELLRSAGYFVEKLWHVDDVHFIAEQLGLDKLDDAEAQQVFEIASNLFDGETGICWPQLERALQIFLHQRKSLRAICERATA
jgi:hypothetical protein